MIKLISNEMTNKLKREWNCEEGSLPLRGFRIGGISIRETIFTTNPRSKPSGPEVRTRSQAAGNSGRNSRRGFLVKTVVEVFREDF